MFKYLNVLKNFMIKNIVNTFLFYEYILMFINIIAIFLVHSLKNNFYIIILIEGLILISKLK